MVVRHRSSGLHAYVLTVSAVGFGSLALDGRLYQFLSTFNRPFRPNELTAAIEKVIGATA